MSKISIIGLGKLGAPMLAAYASRGHKVIGVDISEKVVKSVNESKPHIQETDYANFIKKYEKNISATSDIKYAILNSDITFIIAQTPSNPDGSFSNIHVLSALEKIGKALGGKNKYHLVIVSSTIMPTSSIQEFIPCLEKSSGKKCGKNFGFCYNPEFIALGSVIRDLLNPDFVLIGAFNKKSGDLLEKFYRTTIPNVKIERMNPTNAEITKIALNSYITMKISFANMLTQLCERVPGGNVDSVTKALGHDTRVGSKYFKGGLGFGGPCFPRDNKAFGYAVGKTGVSAVLPQANDKFNDQHAFFLAEKVKKSAGTVGILGISFKPETDVIEKSAGMLLAELLTKAGKKVMLYDPMALQNAQRVFGNKVRYAKSADECMRHSQTVVITTPWKEFSNIPLKTLKIFLKKKQLVDCWRIFDQNTLNSFANYFSLGINKNGKN